MFAKSKLMHNQFFSRCTAANCLCVNLMCHRFDNQPCHASFFVTIAMVTDSWNGSCYFLFQICLFHPQYPACNVHISLSLVNIVFTYLLFPSVYMGPIYIYMGPIYMGPIYMGPIYIYMGPIYRRTSYTNVELEGVTF